MGQMFSQPMVEPPLPPKEVDDATKRYIALLKGVEKSKASRERLHADFGNTTDAQRSFIGSDEREYRIESVLADGSLYFRAVSFDGIVVDIGVFMFFSPEFNMEGKVPEAVIHRILADGTTENISWNPEYEAFRERITTRIPNEDEHYRNEYNPYCRGIDPDDMDKFCAHLKNVFCAYIEWTTMPPPLVESSDDESAATVAI